jgi:hypothetical protein
VSKQTRAADLTRVREIARQHEAPVEFVRLNRDLKLADWRDPDDNDPKARAPKMIRAYRRIDVLAKLERDGKLVTREHRAGGERYRTDYEIGHEGASPGGARGERVQQSFQQGGPTLMQLAHLTAYRQATQAIGFRLSGLVMHVVLHNQDVTPWAKQRGVFRDVAMGYLIGGLDRLCDHYGTFSDEEMRAID